MRSRSPSRRPVIVVVGDILAAWESTFVNSLPRDRETIAKITTSSLHHDNNSRGDEYHERFVVIGSIPILLLRPFLPPTVPLVCFVDFQPIAIGSCARSILFETKILLESVTNVKNHPCKWPLRRSYQPVVPRSSITSEIEVKLISRFACRRESVVRES